MFRSLNIAATGMAAQQLNTEVIANNIANLNTTGFKRQRADFHDLLYQDRGVSVGSRTSDSGSVVSSGTQTGEFMGLPASGKRVDVRLIDIMRFDHDGLVCEHWGVVDMLALLQQLGVVPEGAQA